MRPDLWHRKASWLVMSLRHCTVSGINRFTRTSTKVWDSPGPISLNPCRPQQQNRETTWDSFQYLWSLSFCPLRPDFWEGRPLHRTELHGTGPQGSVKRSSWCTLMTGTKTWEAVWMFWSFHYVIPSRHVYNSLKMGAEMRWCVMKMMFVMKYSYLCREIGKINIHISYRKLPLAIINHAG